LEKEKEVDEKWKELIKMKIPMPNLYVTFAKFYLHVIEDQRASKNLSLKYDS
jgi:hypothetical protein